ncbi:MAG: hypothetical protein U0Q16_35190 [Bryobacteraceae bacterium]
MNGGFWNTLKRFVLWDYPRATWQYDVMVGLILAFIFLTPREIFRDQPRPKNVMLLSSDKDGASFLIEPHSLAGLDEQARLVETERLIHSQIGGKNRSVQRIQPIVDSGENEIRGYIVYTRP